MRAWPGAGQPRRRVSPGAGGGPRRPPCRPRHARRPGGDGLHHRAQGGHPARPGFPDRIGHQGGQFAVAELGRQVVSEHVALGPLTGGLPVAPGGGERVRGLPPALDLAGQHAQHFIVGQLPGGPAGDLLLGDRGQRHPQRPGAQLVPCLHRCGQVGAEPVFQCSHGSIIPRSARNTAHSQVPPARALASPPDLPWLLPAPALASPQTAGLPPAAGRGGVAGVARWGGCEHESCPP